MTEQEAIGKLNMLDEALNFQRYDADECSFALNMAIEALEKQIPKEPKYIDVDSETMDMETGEYLPYILEEAHCSCCDVVVGVDGARFSEYCHNCGQAIKWGYF